MYVNNETEVLLEALTRNRRTRRPPGYDIRSELRKLEERVTERIDHAVGAQHESDDVEAVRIALGPNVLIAYGTFLKANNISYELGQVLRDEGTLKVLRVRGKLMVRLGHADEFVRKLPLAK